MLSFILPLTESLYFDIQDDHSGIQVYGIHLDVKVKMAQTSHREGRMKRWTRFRFLGGIFCSESGATTVRVLYQVA